MVLPLHCCPILSTPGHNCTPNWTSTYHLVLDFHPWMACPGRLGGKNVQSLEKSRCSFLIIMVFQHILHSFWNYWWCLQFWLTLRQCNWICEFFVVVVVFCGASGPKTWNFLLEINSTAIFCVVSIRSGIVEDVYVWSLWQRVLRMLQETLSLLMTLRRYTV